MKYYVVSDIHGYYTAFRTALQTAGFDDDIGEKRIIILGDLFDRGSEAIKLQNYILHLMREDLVILVRGNHEDLFEDLVTVDKISNEKYAGNAVLGKTYKPDVLSKKRYKNDGNKAPMYVSLRCEPLATAFTAIHILNFQDGKVAMMNTPTTLPSWILLN